MFCPSASIASTTPRTAALGNAVAASSSTSSRAPRNVPGERLAVSEGKEPVAAAEDDERGNLHVGQPFTPTWFAVELGEHLAKLAGHVD